MSSTVIRVGGQAPVFTSFADFLDGISAQVRRAEIRIEESASGPVLVIMPPESAPQRWPLADIRRLPDQAGGDILVLSVLGNAVARLLVSDREARAIITARCPKLTKRQPVAHRARLLGWAVGAVASVALIIFVLVPRLADQLATFLPPAGEKALGDATFEQIRTALGNSNFQPVRVCDSRAGTAALDRMRMRLQDQVDLPYPLALNVLDHEMVNAFALPGGRVVLFRGLIDKARSPDEVAAVLAHEIGHVVNRDPARGALRSAGSIGVLGLIFGDFAGGTAVLFLVNRLIDANYSQQAEAKADAFAHATLMAAKIPPSAMATMFKRLLAKGGEPSGIVAHFQAHPKMGDRIAAAQAADTLPKSEAIPALTPADWTALQNICS